MIEINNQNLIHTKIFNTFIQKYCCLEKEEPLIYDELDDFDKDVIWQAFVNYLFYIGFEGRKRVFQAVKDKNEIEQEAIINELDWK